MFQNLTKFKEINAGIFELDFWIYEYVWSKSMQV